MNKIDEIMAQVLTTLQMGNEFTESGHTFGFKQFVTELTKLRVMIEDALKVPEGWQPIESAPKDGMIVLLRGKRAIADGFFNGKAWIWPYINAEPTHWMPLPATPKQEEV